MKGVSLLQVDLTTGSKAKDPDRWITSLVVMQVMVVILVNKAVQASKTGGGMTVNESAPSLITTEVESQRESGEALIRKEADLTTEAPLNSLEEHPQSETSPNQPEIPGSLNM